MDDKGRVVLPSQIRNAVPATDGAAPLVVAYGVPGEDHLILYARDDIETRRRQVRALKGTGETKRQLQLYFFAHTADVEIDSAGRILIDKTARSRLNAGARDQLVFVGMGETVEVWTPEGYEKNFGVPYEVEDAPAEANIFANVDPAGLLEDLLDAQTAGRE